MQVHELVQGSAAWLAHRAQHFNASDAPAMMGCSSYKTRSALVAELATGIGEEITPEKQRLFDNGHRGEGLYRPHAELIIGEPLYPVTGSKGKLSSSFDGITLDERIAFEHKSLNDRLRQAFASMGGDIALGHLLPLEYRVQMEQQIEVSGCEKVLFAASKWDGEGNLVEAFYCWYYPDPALREQLIAGWAQLEHDVCSYAPPAAAAVQVVGKAGPALPGVSVSVEGSLVVTTNLDKFEVALKDFIEHRLITQPKSDQDFADLDLQIKAMKGAEAALESSDANMLAQIAPVDTALKHSALLHELVRKHRLLSEKLLTSEKDRRKLEIVANAQKDLREHIDALTARLGKPYMPTIPADFAAEIKGMRSLDKMEEVTNTLLVNLKLQASGIADKIDANLKYLREHAANHAFLFSDASTIVLKAPDDLQMLVKARIFEHDAEQQRKQEEERERIRAEEVERAQREAREDLERRQRAVAAIRFPEPEPEPAPAVQSPAPLSLVTANNAARAAIAQETVSVAQQAPAHAGGYRPISRSASVAPAREVVWINTAQLSERLNWPMTAALCEELGFPGTKRSGPGMWWDEAKAPAIGRAAAARISKAVADLAVAA